MAYVRYICSVFVQILEFGALGAGVLSIVEQAYRRAAFAHRYRALCRFSRNHLYRALHRLVEFPTYTELNLDSRLGSRNFENSIPDPGSRNFETELEIRQALLI